MKEFITEIEAIDPIDGELKIWAGPKIQSISIGMAQKWCDENGLAYCKVVGEFIFEVPCKEGFYGPDEKTWDQVFRMNYKYN